MHVRSLRRRDFIAFFTGVAAWPLGGHAQQPERIRRVGVLLAFPEQNSLTQGIMSAFARALEQFGWVEGKNIRIDYRFASADPGLFARYAASLVGMAPDAVFATTAPATAALRQQTTTIPIVFVFVPDPVGLGFVRSLARPGGNLTGFSSYDAPIMGKWLQLLTRCRFIAFYLPW
jgi:putative ABC transport system substrate-binding protein